MCIFTIGKNTLSVTLCIFCVFSVFESRQAELCIFRASTLLAHFLIYGVVYMYYSKRYTVDIDENYHTWFYENNNDVYFGTDDNNSIEYDVVHIPKSCYGRYDNLVYIAFAGDLYVTDVRNMITQLIMHDVYNVNFLNNCIIATIKKKNRFDEIIKIVPENHKVESIGTLKNENTIR